MRKVFGYIRVSTAKQGEGVSLEEQRAAIESYAQRSNFEILRWFEERQTAAKRGRPVFIEMLRQLARGEAAGVVIHKIDRSARNLKDWADLGELIDSGVDVHFANESLDLHSRGGRLSADIQAVVAADYIRNLREETRKGFYGRLKQGLYPLPAPVGYLDMGKGKPKEIDPVKGPLVRMAFELYGTQQYSLPSLAREMESRRLRSKSGGRVGQTGLSTILNNPFYFGLIRIRQTGENFPGCHQPIIKKALFDRVQLILRGKTVPRVTKHSHLYRRLIECKQCGYSLIGELQKGRVYYRCHTKGCPTAVRQDAFDAAVKALLSEVCMGEEHADLFRGRIEEIERNSRADGETEASGLELQTKGLSERLRRLTDAVIDGVIDRQTYEERKLAALQSQKELEERVRQLKAGEYPVLDTLRKNLELSNVGLLSYKLGDPEEKREIIESVTSNRVASGKYIAIEPSEPFRTFAKTAKSLDGAPSRGVPRILDRILSHIVQAVTSGRYQLVGEGTNGVRLVEAASGTESSPELPPAHRRAA